MIPVGLVPACLAGCANEQPPPGALPDTRPPQVAETVPPRDSVVPGFRGAARVRFDEPVRLTGDIGRQVTASPADRYRFSTGFSGIEIEPEGGWREGAVYCFEIPEGIVDLLGNRTQAPIPFCFSTGPPVPRTRVEGRVEDRVSGQPRGGARVLFLGLPADTTPYTAVAGGAGEFVVRSLPPGSYWAYAFEDRNRNLRLDHRTEPHDSAWFRLDEATGAPDLSLALVEPDSTPPALLAAIAEDSVTLRLEFDDPLPVEQQEADVAVRDSVGVALPVRLLHVGEPGTVPPEARLPVEEEERTAEPAPEAEAPDRPSPEPPAARDTAERRPSRTVTLLLDRQLVPGRYSVVARGFVNLRHLVGGGDTTFVHPREPGGR